MTYTLVNAVFLVAAGAAAWLLLRRVSGRRRALALILGTFAVVALFTAVFDSIMVGTGLVAYDEQHLSGIRVGLAPIEDFAYVVLAAMLLPAVWLGLPGRKVPDE